MGRRLGDLRCRIRKLELLDYKVDWFTAGLSGMTCSNLLSQHRLVRAAPISSCMTIIQDCGSESSKSDCDTSLIYPSHLDACLSSSK